MKDIVDVRKAGRVHDRPSTQSMLREIITRDGFQACSAKEVIST